MTVRYHIGTICETKLVEDSSERKSYVIEYYKGDGQGYEENDVTVNFYPDGTMSIWGNGEGSVYLHTEQMSKLESLLADKLKSATELDAENASEQEEDDNIPGCFGTYQYHDIG